MNIFQWLYDRYFFTGLLILWGVLLFTTITIKVFFAPVTIPASTAGALLTVYGVIPLVVGLLKWRVERAKSSGGS